MKETIKSWLRPGRKFTDIFIIAAIFSVLLLFAGTLISNLAFVKLNITKLLSDWAGSENIGTFLSDYLNFIGIWIAILLAVLIPRGNRPMMKALGHNRSGNNIKGILVGILLGFGSNAFCILISALTGHIKLSFYGFQPAILLAFFIAVFIQSGAEEITDRLYLYQKLRRRYKNKWVAIIVNALVFMSLHIMNDGFTWLAGSQIVLVGVLFSLFVYYYDSLWAAMFFHTMWNYTQNIIFGLPNSGIVSEYSIFKLDAASATNGFFYNVNFGVEGSVGSSLVLLIEIIIIVLINKDKPEKNDLWAEGDAAAEAGYGTKGYSGKHAKN